MHYSIKRWIIKRHAISLTMRDQIDPRGKGISLTTWQWTSRSFHTQRLQNHFPFLFLQKFCRSPPISPLQRLSTPWANIIPQISSIKNNVIFFSPSNLVHQCTTLFYEFIFIFLLRDSWNFFVKNIFKLRLFFRRCFFATEKMITGCI